MTASRLTPFDLPEIDEWLSAPATGRGRLPSNEDWRPALGRARQNDPLLRLMRSASDEIGGAHTVDRVLGVPRRRTLCRTGTESTTAYLVLSGSLALALPREQQRRRLIGVVGPGHWIGVFECLSGDSWSADLVGLTQAIVVEVPAGALLTTLRDFVTATAALKPVLADARQAYARRQSLLRVDVATRLAAVLCDLCDDIGRPLPGGGILLAHGLSQSGIAQLAGTTRENASKKLGRFQALGIISVGRHVINVLDEPALRRRAGRCSAAG